MARLWFACALSAVIGAGTGWALHGPSSAATDESAGPAAARVAQLVLSQPQPAASPGLDLSQLHAAIREELAASARFQGGSQQPAATAPKQNVPASPELVAQQHAALQDIQGMISAGEWGSAQRTEFQQKLSVLDPDQARQALQQVLIALNNGSINALTKQPL